jgi:1-acyl-sn-glycerol-3-phosphate acyltransferase
MAAGLFRPLRGGLSLLAVVIWFVVNAPLCYLFVLPLGALWSGRRRNIVSLFMRHMSRGILFLFELGGARFSLRGVLPTGGPSVILMNHQSQLDIPIAALMGRPYVPAFVPRELYTRWYIPLVAPSIWLLECPVVDPRRDPHGALEAMRLAATRQNHGLVVFPEGHRSLDGNVRPFRAAGTVASLGSRRVPVYLVVVDGLWEGRRFVDFLANVPRLRGEIEVLGPFEPPGDAAALPAFVEECRGRIVRHLELMRDRHGHA